MSAAGDALREMADKADNAGAREAAVAMGKVAVQADQELLGLSSHPPRTPTPSAPGTPPSRISGSLRGSVDDWLHVQHGAGIYEVRVGPVDVVYSRIQELGGRAGRGHMTYLPPRPYMRPALDQLTGSGELARVASEAFERAVS